MKVSIAKDQLLTGLQAVQNVVSSRTTLAILSNVLIRATGNRLEMTATDLDVSVSLAVAASVQVEGAVTLPAKKLFGITRELAAPEIELVLGDKSVVSIQAGTSFYKIHGMPAEDFPSLPTFAEQKVVTLQQQRLKSMLRKTSFAVSTDESRFVLNGIYFSLKEDKVSLVATDGRRLALTDEEVELPEGAEGDFIVPTKAINELNRLLGAGAVDIRFGDNQVGLTLHPSEEGGHATYVISKLVDGTYPNFRQVIPQESLERVTLPREELLQALKRAEIMTSDKSNSVKMAFTKNQLAITANTQDVGEARETLTINYKGKDIAIAFNPTYLMDPLKALETDEIFFEISDELSPGVVKCNEPFLYVIMPMRMS
jgi:DNA polymerase-3 subunit beta